MAYFAPYLDAAGIHTPGFQDIQNNLVFAAQSIFGQDIYLGNDSQDMQYISAVSKAIYDAMQLCQLAINNQAPQTAVGTGLDSIVKINGITRLAATYSTVAITCIGLPGVVIPAGVVQDTSGNKWDLPANSAFPDSGVLSVTATCEKAGAVLADVGTIQTILTPQYGWTSVSNAAAAVPGVALETDTQIRKRQSISVGLPSQTVLDGIAAKILAVDGVTRQVTYENSTGLIDANGIPGHSTASVVEGGDDTLIAEAIAIGKTPGAGTYGPTAITLPPQYSIRNAINFSRPAYDVIDVNITMVILTSNYTQAVQDQIVSNVKDYLNSLQIGTSVQSSTLWLPALSALANLASPSFGITSITVSTNGGDPASSIPVAWNEVTKAGTVTITGGL